MCVENLATTQVWRVYGQFIWVKIYGKSEKKPNVTERQDLQEMFGQKPNLQHTRSIWRC